MMAVRMNAGWRQGKGRTQRAGDSEGSLALFYKGHTLCSVLNPFLILPIRIKISAPSFGLNPWG